MTSIQRTIKTILSIYIKGPFRKEHLVAILIGVFIGGTIGIILLSSDHGRQYGVMVVIGFVIGAVLGAGFAVSLVPPEPHKK